MRVSALISVSFLFALVCVGQGYSQEQDQQTETETPPSQEVIIDEPAFVGVIENPETTETSDKREEDSWDIQKRDLVAQERMADATEAMNKATQSMMWAAWASVGFVFIGTFLLAWTLILTRKANQAAIDVVNVTKNAERPIVEVEDLDIDTHGTYGTKIILNLQNYGRTAAQNIKFSGELIINRGASPEESPILAYLKYLPANSQRTASGDFNVNCFTYMEEVLLDMKDAGSHGRATKTVITVDPNDTPNSVQVVGTVSFEDRFGNKEMFPVRKIAYLHISGNPCWLD